MSLDTKHTEASFSVFSLNLTHLLCLRVAEVTRSLDMAIFVLMMTTTTPTAMTMQPITLSPCACVRGNNVMWRLQ